MSFDFDRWNPKDKVSAGKLNQPLDAIGQHLPIVAGRGIQATILPSGGTTVGVSTTQWGRIGIIVGKIVDAGPVGQPDYTDYRYWVQIVRNKLTDTTVSTDSTIDLEDEPTNNVEDVIVTAINLADYISGTPSLTVDTLVQLALLDVDTLTTNTQVAQLRWFIVGGGGIKGVYPVKVTKTGGSAGNATTQCTYTYGVTTTDGLTTLGAGMSPVKARMSVGAYDFHNGYGLGFDDESGSFKLWDANETPQVGGCT